MKPEASEERANNFLRMIRRSRRGRLKIYLGYGAGVGKTYQMLQEGHRLKSLGVDVVIGLVEPHGREETSALVEGLEIVPRMRQEYRGHILEEMDLNAILGRAPEVALIDELAHTNVPGGQNAKRYQDVQDILNAGIHVITTLNVQHLESLYDTVQRSIHVNVRERLPDTIVGEADEIVNVDLTPEDLQQRLRDGKIYPHDRIDTALANFFQTSNLEKLRELTLRELAAQIDVKIRERSEEGVYSSPDQVMVCLSSRGPNSEMLLRYASRLAGRFNRNWYAVYVQTPPEEPTMIDAHTQRILSGTLTLAKQLGAMVFTYKGEDIEETILRFAEEYRVGHIVIGSPTKIPFWKRWMGKKSVVEGLIARSRGITIVVLDTRTKDVPGAEPDTVFLKDARPILLGSNRIRFTDLLTSRRIIIWDNPVEKEVVLKALVEVAATDCGDCSFQEIWHAVSEREKEGSTFLNEGVALPHARLDGLPAPVITMGLTHNGLLDVVTARPIEIVFLILSPSHPPDMQINVLAAVSRAAQDRELLKGLAQTKNSEEAMAIVREWGQDRQISTGRMRRALLHKAITKYRDSQE